MSEPDIDVFHKIKQGDLKIYEQFFKSNYAEIVRYAVKFVREKGIAEEIAQEVFLYLWQKRSAINIDSSLKSYIFSATRNRAINYIRLELPKLQAQVDITEFDQGYDHNFLEEKSQVVEKLVQKSIGDLPEKCREIFILSRQEGLTYEEIAEELSLSKKTVENQMGIALKKLRASLDVVIKKVRNDS